jgi:hypothetical protein
MPQRKQRAAFWRSVRPTAGYDASPDTDTPFGVAQDARKGRSFPRNEPHPVNVGLTERCTMTDAKIRTDAEFRGLVLKQLYDLRTKSDWVNWDNFHELGLPQQEVGRYLKELHELGLAEGKFVVSRENGEYSDIQVRVRARGASAVENTAKRPPEIIIDQNIEDVQYRTLNIDIINAAIDISSATMIEKAAAKSLLQSLDQNKLLINLLQKWFAGHLPR